MKHGDVFCLLLILLGGHCLGQDQHDFRYKRNISGVAREGWYSLSLPSDIFDDIAKDFGDLRLYSIHDSDTAESPYLLDVRHDQVSTEAVHLPVFNQSMRDGSLYLSFELKSDQKVNHIDLRFEESNYFGYVTIEGSADREKWFELVKGHRIVSVKGGGNDYVLSAVDFPVADYRYLRAAVTADVPLTLKTATFQLNKTRAGVYHDVPLKWKMLTDKKARKSFVDITFDAYVPVSFISVEIDTSADFYRSMDIEYLRDSAKTEKGWVKYYETVHNGHLTSFTPNKFNFDWQLAREIRLVIRDNDDSPLSVTGISAAGPDVQLVSRLKPGINFLLYGAEGIRSPSYDLAYFENKIPDDLMTANIEPAEALIAEGPESSPLFESKFWLWGLMAVMIAGLGFFTIKMMRRGAEK